jgi:lysophospholipase L1-like esterase
VGAWAAGQQLTEPDNLPPAPGLWGNTLRQKLLLTLPAERLRVLLSNAWGDAPVTFRAVHVAHARDDDDIDPATDTPLRFDGSPSLTLQPGQSRFSDAARISIAALGRLAISICFGQVPGNVSGHPGSRTTSYLRGGNAVAAAALPGAVTTDHWYYVEGVDVEAARASAAVVTLGDSLTDGRGSTTNHNDRWPDRLARRLQASAATRGVAVLNQGIGGNAVVAGGLGPTATQRFGRDVLEQRGARWVIVLEGVNDIGCAADAGVAQRLIAAYDALIERAHERGLRMYGVPVLPFGGSFYDNPVSEAARQVVNRWIRESGRFDAVLPLDEVVADPDQPTRLLSAFDTGDHLHLSPAGYRAMADAIDLSLLTP